MKKLFALSIASMFVIALAVPAFAEVAITSTGTAIGGATYSPSTSVTVNAVATTTDYTATAGHASSRTGAGYQYGTTNGDSTIMKKAFASEAADAWPASAGTAGTMPTGFAP